jgi:hypothetical protein
MFRNTGQCRSLRKARWQSFFCSTLPYQESEGQPPNRVQQDGLRLTVTPVVVLFIALPETEDEIEPW